MSWGVETFKTVMVEHTDEMVRQVDEQLLEAGRVDEGDLVVIIAGAPPGIPGSTNALRVHRIGWLSDLDPALVLRALETGERLVCSLGLTDDEGHPRCASVRPPDLAWSLAGPDDREADSGER